MKPTIITLLATSSLWLAHQLGAAFNSTPVDEVFFTTRHPRENVDSPAAWAGPGGTTWLLSTCKGTHNLRIENGLNGDLVRYFGGLGDAPGQFNRPNGISVVDDLLFVVERDNRRVQLISLPTMHTIITFGEDALRKPYGLHVHRQAKGRYTVYVTDDYAAADGSMPADSDLGERIKVYELEVEGTAPQTADAELAFAFGAVDGPGRLFIVESIYADPAHNRLLIADEEMSARGQSVKVYTMDGVFTGQLLGKGQFQFQAEGIALYPYPNDGGYWIFTDQGKAANYFHVYDRLTLDYVGSFHGPGTLNTDGVWLHPAPVGARYPEGLFFAVHNDMAVAAFDWREIRAALGLPAPR
jgi:3-phytase